MRGYIVHEHPDLTSEGFGSLARSEIFPLVHIAVTCDLQPLIADTAFGLNTARNDYGTLDVNAFLSLTPTLSPPPPSLCMCSSSTTATTTEIVVNTWNDANLGMCCCGDGRLLAMHLCEYLDDWTARNAINTDDDTTTTATMGLVVVRLVGALRCMDPTVPVYQWMQQLSSTWKLSKNERNYSDLVDVDDDSSSSSNSRILRIAAHVRVPEEFTPQFWKEDNHVSKLIAALDTLGVDVAEPRDSATGTSCSLNLRNGKNSKSVQVQLDVFTEQAFTAADEALLKQKYAQQVCVHRGTTQTLLDDIRHMATADMFVPSSSFLSAFVGYLTHGIILIADPSRWQYFAPHRDLIAGYYSRRSSCYNDGGGNGILDTTMTDAKQLGVRLCELLQTKAMSGSTAACNR